MQHEFGIYGGPAGSHLLALLKEVRMPVVTTLHTVLREPNADAAQGHGRSWSRRSDRLVVMARKGAEILREIYGVPDAKIDLIPHGIPDIPFVDSSFYKAQFGVEGRMVLLTFGLLGPGKGIEHVIEALPEIVRRHPNVVYLVLGATHPHLVAREGESYRLSLERLAEDRGVKENVIFYNRFVSLDDLKEFIGATDIYLTPYLNEAQITSGTLAYVFGAGKAVVSTPYWHAQELLADGRGDARALPRSAGHRREASAPSSTIRRCWSGRAGNAYQMGREMIWPAVAQRYLESFQQARAGPQGHAAHGLRRLDAGEPALRPAAAPARSPRAHERRHRHLPARHLQRAELPRRLLHRRQRPRLHPVQSAGGTGRAASGGEPGSAWPPATSRSCRRP